MATKPKRMFTFQDAKSDKFWSISLDGDAHTVQFGRSGTDGQAKTKAFDSAEKAAQSYEKLIAQKTKKGYVEAQAKKSAKKKTAKAKSVKKKTAKAKSVKKKTAKAKSAKKKARRELSAADFEPRFELSPLADYFSLSRDPEPLERGPARDFDKQRCLDELRGMAKTFRSVYSTQPLEVLPSALSTEEAAFWYEVLRRIDHAKPPAAVAAELANQDTFTVSQEEIQQEITVEEGLPPFGVPGLRWVGAWGVDACLRILPHLLGERELNDLLVARMQQAGMWSEPTRSDPNTLDAYRRHVAPYLSRKERARFAKVVSQGLTPESFAAPEYSSPPAGYPFAALLGARDVIEELFATFPDDRFHANYGHAYLLPNKLVFGLGDPERMVQEARRLRIRMQQPEQIEAWLAFTGCAGLDVAVDSVLEQTTDTIDNFAKAFLRARHPEAVPFVLALRSKRKIVKRVGTWLQDNSGIAARGLIRMAAGGGSKPAEGWEGLADLALDHPEAVRRALELEAPSPDVAARVESLLDPDATQRTGVELPPQLAKAFAAVAALPELKKKDVAEWLRPGRLDPPRLSTGELGVEQVGWVLRALLETPLQGAEPSPGHTLLTELKAQATPESLEAFAWSAYGAWERNGFPSKQKWILLALGHFGADLTVAKLTPLVRAWPGQSQHARAVLGLDCLRAIGSDVSLSALAGIAQKLKFRALKQRAGECMQDVAAERGLTKEALADRLVPDCGLEPSGERSFDYGTRSFAFCLGPELKPMVRAQDGKLLKAPPKPGKRDDATLAPQALADWRLFKKQVQGVLKIQRVRLEQAMVAGRRWTLSDFEAFLVQHPLLRRVIPGVLWGSYGKALTPFRVTEAGEYRDLDDKPLSLAKQAPVGVVHPLQLSADARAAWLALWDRRDLLTPFPQLDREVYTFTPSELSGHRFEFSCGGLIPHRTLRGALLGQGWTRGQPQDAGIVGEHLKQFPAAEVTAVLQHGGLSVVPYEFEEDQPVECVLFLDGLLLPEQCVWLRENGGTLLKDVDPTVLSEVARDLALFDTKRSDA